MTDNSQPGLEDVYRRQRAFVSGYATPARLEALTSGARRAGLVIQTATEMDPDDPIVTQSLSLSAQNGLNTYARPTPISQLFLSERAGRILDPQQQRYLAYGYPMMHQQVLGQNQQGGTNHGLHTILSILTAGVWVPVWLIFWAIRGRWLASTPARRLSAGDHFPQSDVFLPGDGSRRRWQVTGR